MTSSAKVVSNSHSVIFTVTVQESQISQFLLAERAAKDSYGTIQLIAKEERGSA